MCVRATVSIRGRMSQVFPRRRSSILIRMTALTAALVSRRAQYRLSTLLKISRRDGRNSPASMPSGTLRRQSDQGLGSVKATREIVRHHSLRVVFTMRLIGFRCRLVLAHPDVPGDRPGLLVGDWTARQLEGQFDLTVMVALVPDHVLEQKDRVVVVKVHIPASL